MGHVNGQTGKLNIHLFIHSTPTQLTHSNIALCSIKLKSKKQPCADWEDNPWLRIHSVTPLVSRWQNTLVIEFWGGGKVLSSSSSLSESATFQNPFLKERSYQSAKEKLLKNTKSTQNPTTGEKREDNTNCIRRSALLHLYLFILPCTRPGSASGSGSTSCLSLCLVQWPQIWEHSHIHKTHVRAIPGGAGKGTIIPCNHGLHTAPHRKQWRIPREVIQSHFSLSSLT